MKTWVESAAAKQGISLAPGRAERLAPGVQALLEALEQDPLRAALQFEVDPTSYLLMLKTK